MKLLKRLYQKFINRFRRKVRWERVNTEELPELVGW